MTQSFNPFAGMRQAQTSQQGNYFSPGTYKVRVNKCVYRSTQNSGDVFLIETTILESSDPTSQPVGADRTWMQSTKNKQVYLAAVKALCAALVGLDLKNDAHAALFREKVEPKCEEIMTAAIVQGLLNGREITVDVSKKEKKNTPGEFFNLHTFKPAQAPLQGLAS